MALFSKRMEFWRGTGCTIRLFSKLKREIPVYGANFQVFRKAVSERRRLAYETSLIRATHRSAGTRTESPNPTKNAVGMEFVKIAPGEFMMGCSTGDSECQADEKPAHRVQITKAF